MSYEIKLPLFEGPFDLLLFFIERDELDIQDIPIAQVTRDFLDYTHRLEEMDLEVASEFILVAATLMRIKSKMLLPRKQLDAKGEEIDPREELVARLIEYKKYKAVSEELEKREEERLKKEPRGGILAELKAIEAQTDAVEAELQDVDLYKLLKVYRRVMERMSERKERKPHAVVPYPYTIAEQKKRVLDRLKKAPKVSFVEIMEDSPDKVAVVFNFLAVLELLTTGEVQLTLGEGFNNFWLGHAETTQAADG